MSNPLDQEMTLAGHSANSSGKSSCPKRRGPRARILALLLEYPAPLPEGACPASPGNFPLCLARCWRQPNIDGSRNLTQLHLLACYAALALASTVDVLALEMPLLSSANASSSNECHSPRVNLSNRSHKSSRLTRRPPNGRRNSKNGIKQNNFHARVSKVLS